MDVLSQSLNPEYVARLQLNLRPFEAMLLLIKHALKICVMYTAALATLISAGIYLQASSPSMEMSCSTGLSHVICD